MRSDFADLTIAILVIGLAVPGCYDAVDFRSGAKLLPLLALATLIGLNTILIVKTILQKHDVKKINIPILRVSSLLLMCLTYTFLIEKIGFFISSTLFFIVIVGIFDRKRLVPSIFASLGVSAFIYLVFSLGFSIYLPTGELWG
ncbi:tripartite tricarboxylate transporter TctB family protein [Shumkonia mesophila]|uniref:tripartite tricarboxylate transporter TctB family protein n=1 Tax=Shumkonia mesophila TaxID=2838854 RepID=UPI00293497D9|nr:tripartite tricarboxylate transporter TctB family protein [Shumkonia mesophila]